jgi:hypothetical protein
MASSLGQAVRINREPGLTWSVTGPIKGWLEIVGYLSAFVGSHQDACCATPSNSFKALRTHCPFQPAELSLILHREPGRGPRHFLLKCWHGCNPEAIFQWLQHKGAKAGGPWTWTSYPDDESGIDWGRLYESLPGGPS